MKNTTKTVKLFNVKCSNPHCHFAGFELIAREKNKNVKSHSLAFGHVVTVVQLTQVYEDMDPSEEYGTADEIRAWESSEGR